MTTCYRSIRCESDDVIWLRNHAYTWMLVPNIGCKQTMVSNTGGPLTFFDVHTLFFSDYPKAIRRGEISFKLNHVIERNFEAANGRITELVQASYKNRKCLGNFPKHVLPYPCYDAKAPRQYPVPLPCTPRCINAVCFGEHIFNSRRSDFTCRTLRGNHSTLIRQRCDNILR